ncbi:MAG: alpha-L-fucosidase [Candidatus Sumerlaeota bacterium]|nr:alpha-L-fucosidase [Candidatus Sumerlaeota bacterium]
MGRIHRSLVIASIAILGGQVVFAGDAGARLGPPREEKIARFQDWRFGMFIHWSLASGFGRSVYIAKLGGDIMTLARNFDQNAVKFDADAYVALAKRAGCRYIVPVIKHEDGFCLWPTETTPFHAQREYPAELVAAAHKQDLGILFYYSWETRLKAGQPNAGLSNEELQRLRVPQIRELLARYRPDGIWIDNVARPESLLAEVSHVVRATDPKALLGDKNPAYAAQGLTDFAESEGAYSREASKGFRQAGLASEWCERLPHDGKETRAGWFADVMEPLPPLTDEEVGIAARDKLASLIHCVGTGTNYLLDVMPLPSGEVLAPHAQIMEAIGRWVAPRGEAIYGTRMMPEVEEKWGYAVSKGGAVYLHVLSYDETTMAKFRRRGKKAKTDGGAEQGALLSDRTGLPADKRISVALRGEVAKAHVIPGDTEIPYQVSNNVVSLDLSSVEIDPVDTIIRLAMND